MQQGTTSGQDEPHINYGYVFQPEDDFNNIDFGDDIEYDGDVVEVIPYGNPALHVTNSETLNSHDHSSKKLVEQETSMEDQPLAITIPSHSTQDIIEPGGVQSPDLGEYLDSSNENRETQPKTKRTHVKEVTKRTQSTTSLTELVQKKQKKKRKVIIPSSSQDLHNNQFLIMSVSVNMFLKDFIEDMSSMSPKILMSYLEHVFGKELFSDEQFDRLKHALGNKAVRFLEDYYTKEIEPQL